MVDRQMSSPHLGASAGFTEQLGRAVYCMASASSTTSSAKMDIHHCGNPPANSLISVTSLLSTQTSIMNTKKDRSQQSQAGAHVQGGNENLNGGHWIGCEAGPGVHQLNGIVIEDDAKLTNQLAQNPPKGKYTYDNCVKRGLGDQINGCDVTYSGDEEVAAVPILNGEWNNVLMLSLGSANIAMQGSQVNGGRLKKVANKDHEGHEHGAGTVAKRRK
ncbi:hypothetical protein G7046_g3601 [Stylonectria norvegica]|nr:hypothetical protein G7046_g3601 [Stylonectria norvegica]